MSNPWSSRNEMVGTTKRSIATMPSAWLRRNVFHPCEGGAAAASRFPAPIQSETGAVPTDHGVRSDYGKCIITLGKQSADASQYQPVNRPKMDVCWDWHAAAH